jgi:hypothetical protein
MRLHALPASARAWRGRRASALDAFFDSLSKHAHAHAFRTGTVKAQVIQTTLLSDFKLSSR